MENKLYFGSDFKQFLKPYENFFYGLKKIYSPNSQKSELKTINSQVSKQTGEADSRKILGDYYRIGKDMKVAIEKYETNRN